MELLAPLRNTTQALDWTANQNLGCSLLERCEVMELQYELVRIDGAKKQGEPIQLR